MGPEAGARNGERADLAAEANLVAAVRAEADRKMDLAAVVAAVAIL